MVLGPQSSATLLAEKVPASASYVAALPFTVTESIPLGVSDVVPPTVIEASEVVEPSAGEVIEMDGSVLSIMKLTVRPRLVLLATSEQGPELTATLLPSPLEVTSLVSPAPEKAVWHMVLSPDRASLAWNWFVTSVVYQPLSPSVPETTPRSVMTGAVVSRTIESSSSTVFMLCVNRAYTVRLPSAPLAKVQLKSV